MKTEIKNNELIIRLPINANPPLSKSGKTRMVATTSGFAQGDAKVSGHPVKVSVNAIIPRD